MCWSICMHSNCNWYTALLTSICVQFPLRCISSALQLAFSQGLNNCTPSFSQSLFVYRDEGNWLHFFTLIMMIDTRTLSEQYSPLLWMWENMLSVLCSYKVTNTFPSQTFSEFVYRWRGNFSWKKLSPMLLSAKNWLFFLLREKSLNTMKFSTHRNCASPLVGYTRAVINHIHFIIYLCPTYSSIQVSEHLLSIYLDEYPDTPWDALKYLVSWIT